LYVRICGFVDENRANPRFPNGRRVSAQTLFINKGASNLLASIKQDGVTLVNSNPHRVTVAAWFWIA
jgi:hypothetical protein